MRLFLIFAFCAMPLATPFAQEELDTLEQRKFERACKQVEQKVSALLNAQTGKDLIADNNNLNKAQLLLSAHSGMNCAREDVNKMLTTHPMLNPVHKNF